MTPILPSWIDRMERTVPWLSIPNLAIYLVVLQVMGFFLVGSKPEMAELLYLDPQAVFSGEVWRLVTFLTVPLSRGLWVIFFLWFLYFVLNSLQHAWGDFRLTLYFLISWVGTVSMSLLLNMPVGSFLYMETTFFFALATLVPDYEIYLFFVLRVKLKWLGIFSAIVAIVLPFLFGSLEMKLLLLVSCTNYLLFFGPGFWRQIKQELRRRR